jgi:hypothetical protein
MEIINEYPINAGKVIEQSDGSFLVHGIGAIREFNSEGYMLSIKKLPFIYRTFI